MKNSWYLYPQKKAQNMPNSRRSARANHLELAQKILIIAFERDIKSGEHLPEQAISKACGVSRTPIRSAFKVLEQKGFVDWQAEQGFFLAVKNTDDLTAAINSLEELEDSLANQILLDRTQRRIGEVHSVSSLVRRYNTSRSLVLVALKILASDGVVMQLPGRFWAFQPILDSFKSIDESISFRLTLEPQAILESGFNIDLKKADLLRTKMQALLNTSKGSITSASFLRLDTQFHSFIAECSGNRFIRGCLMTHQRLRKATQKNTPMADYRERKSIQEHLEILDNIELNQFELASDQMTLHLRKARSRRPSIGKLSYPARIAGV